MFIISCKFCKKKDQFSSKLGMMLDLFQSNHVTSLIIPLLFFPSQLACKGKQFWDAV